MKKFLPTSTSLSINKTYKNSAGFTLIELLVALTIVAILAVSVYVALNPAQRLKDSKDARRSTDVDSILTAVHQYIVDNKGSAPSNMPSGTNEQQIGTGDATACPASVGKCTSLTAGCVNLGATGQLNKYLASIPVDPDTTLGTAASTGYSVKTDVNGIVTVTACHTDGATAISVSR
ncbi:prepilin-type N-terminal cleavage/methylation domain-containing protein [Candidatus Daviesbacteria bacterium]|nr:prepilin-type N-terminal cleavage/methylation domain-containing protein [Candidatus Daviesbacteria bacterium]